MTVYLNLDDLRQATAMLLQAAPQLAQSSAADIYLDQIRDLVKRLDSGAAANGGSVVTDDDLTETDRLHDGYAKAMWHITEAYRALPEVDGDVLEAVERIRASLVPGPDVWTATYPSEAQRAEDKKPQLKVLAEDFALLPIAGGGDVGAWAGLHIKAGITLGKELAARAAAEATAQAQKSSDSPLVRAQLIKTLGEFRTALTAEATRKPKLAPVATTAFALLDQLTAERTATARAAAKKKAKDGAPTAATPSGAGDA